MKHMKKLALLGAIALTLLLGSCDSLFSNKFQEAGLGQTSEAKIQEADAESLVDESGILSGQLTDKFFELLKSNPDLTNATLAKLEAVFDTAKPEIAQAAITLAIQIQLNEVSADEVVANAPAAIALLTDEGFDIDNPEDLQDFLDMLLPADLTGKVKAYDDDQLDAIEAMINKLASKEMNDYFKKLAANIKANELKATDLDMGTLAQTFFLVKILNKVTALYPAGDPNLGASVRELMKNSGKVGIEPSTYFDISKLEDGGFEDILEDEDLKVFLEAGGLDLSELFGDS